MATESPKASISADGVYFIEDPEIGKRVDEFDRQGFPFQTEEGLDFCRRSTLDDARVRDTIESFFERSRLGLLKAYGPRQGRVFSFLNRGETSEKVKVLVALLLSSNSRMVFYKRSHLHPLKAKQATIGLLEVPHESLGRQEIEPFEVMSGGLAIIDGRLGFEILQGVTIMAGFAIEEELQFWSKMRLPRTIELRRKVREMESERIGMNVKFVDIGHEHVKGAIASPAKST